MQLVISEVPDLTLPGSCTLAQLRTQLADLPRKGNIYSVVDREGTTHQFSLEQWGARDAEKTHVRFAFYPSS